MQEPLGDVAPDTPVPFAVPAPLRVGQRVTVKLPGGGSCAQGFVLTVQESTLQYRILFDRPDLRPTDVSLDALAVRGANRHCAHTSRHVHSHTAFPPPLSLPLFSRQSHGRQVLLLPPAPGSGRTVTEAVPEARRVLDSLVFTHALFDVNWQRAAAEREDEERGAAGGAWSLPQQLCGGALQPGTVARAALLLDRRHCLLRALKELNDAVEEDRLPAGEAERRGAARRRAWLVANLGALKPALRAVRRALHAQLRVSLAALRAIVADEQAPEPLRQRAAAALDEVVDLGVLHASRCADAVVCDVEAELPGDGPDRGHGLSPRASLQAEAEAGYGARDAAVPADAKGAGGSGDASSGAGKDGEEERGPMSPPSRKRPRGHGPRGLRPLEALEVATQRDARAAVAVAACTQWCVELGLPSRQAGRALSVLTQQAEQYHSHNAKCAAARIAPCWPACASLCFPALRRAASASNSSRPSPPSSPRAAQTLASSRLPVPSVHFRRFASSAVNNTPMWCSRLEWLHERQVFVCAQPLCTGGFSSPYAHRSSRSSSRHCRRNWAMHERFVEFREHNSWSLGPLTRATRRCCGGLFPRTPPSTALAPPRVG